MHVGQLSYAASHIRDCTFNPDNLPDFLRTDVEKDTLQSGHDASLTGNSKLSSGLPAGQVAKVEILPEHWKITDTV